MVKKRKHKRLDVFAAQEDHMSREIANAIDGEVFREISTISIPKVRRIWPELISADVLSVQPMTSACCFPYLNSLTFAYADPNDRVIYPPDDFTKRKD